MEKIIYKKIYEIEDFYWWHVAFRELVEKYVKKKHIETSNITILDAGCGSGVLAKQLTPYGKVIGVDYMDEAIELSKKRNLKNIKKLDLNNWNYSDNMFDVITCMDVLYHSGIKNDNILINNFYKSLKKDAMLVLSLPAYDILKRQHDKSVFGIRRYKKRQVVKMLKNAGFKKVNVVYRLPHVFIIMLISKLLEYIIKPKNEKIDVKALPFWLNSIMLKINRIENNMILNNLSFPFGSAVFAIAYK